MTAIQRLIWLMAHPLYSKVNNAMQQLTCVNYKTSEQRKDFTKSQKAKDMADTCEMLECLQSRNPVSDNCNLRSIATGINAENRVNVDTAKTVGANILEKIIQMVQKRPAAHLQEKRSCYHALCFCCENQPGSNPNRSTSAISKTHYCGNTNFSARRDLPI